MAFRPAALLAGVFFLGATAALYAWDLGRAPVYLLGDEAQFGNHAYSIARTGRDLSGHFMPLLVSTWDPLGDQAEHEQRQEGRHVWYQPVLFYLIALVLRFAPLTEASIRIPTAMIGGLVDPLLMFLVARRLFRDRLLAALASMTLVMSPAHLILGREALDYICPVPFILGWLYCLVAFIDEGGVWRALAGGFLLGVGLYSFIAAWIFMPLCLLLTWMACVRSGREALPASLAAGVGFALPLVPLGLWLWSNPEMVRETFARYQGYAGEHVALLGTSGFFHLNNIQHEISVYWDYFNPSVLFLVGGPSLTTSTGRAGVFLLPVAVFLPVGFYDLLKRLMSIPIAVVLLGGFVLAPIPATLAGERDMVQRELFGLPFAALIATFGLASLWRSRVRALRAMTALLVALMPLQFAFVYRDYLTHYKLRSAFSYDQAAFRDAADYVIAESGNVPAVYLTRELNYAGPKWRFYVTVHHREDLLSRTRYFDGDDDRELERAAPGSLAVLYAHGSTWRTLVGTGRWSVARRVVDVDGRAASVILKKSS
jgi:hypothetical protein